MCSNVSLLFKYLVKSRLFRNFLCSYDMIHKISQLLVLIIANLARHKSCNQQNNALGGSRSLQFLVGALMYHQYHLGEFSR